MSDNYGGSGGFAGKYSAAEPAHPSREAEIAAHGPTLPEAQRKIADDYGHGWLAGHSRVEQLEAENASLLTQLQQALALTLDLVIEELDRVVMPRDAWVEMRARLDVLRALSPTGADEGARNLLAQLQQAQQERDAAQKAMSYTSEQAHLEWTRAEKAEAALQQAREALKVLMEYCRHSPICSTIGGYEYHCTCGLDAALKAVRW